MWHLVVWFSGGLDRAGSMFGPDDLEGLILQKESNDCTNSSVHGNRLRARVLIYISDS